RRDRGQTLGPPPWAQFLPTRAGRDHPQAWLLGTPPTPADDGEVFTRLRQAGIEGRDSRLAWVEWSAEPTDDFDDPATWAKANPAYGVRIDYEAIAAERAAMTDDQFARERLGIWDEVAVKGVIPDPAWREQADATSLAVDRIALGVECGPDLAWASVALAGQRADGDWHIELDEDQHTKGRGTAWLVPHLESLISANPQIRAVVVDVAGPVAA